MSRILASITQKIEHLASEMKIVYKFAEKYYVNIVKKEVALADITKDDHILCIGGGICPFSAILFHQMTGAKVTVIDNNEKCVCRAIKVIESFGLSEHIRVFSQDGCSSDILYTDYSVVHLALQVYPINRVFSCVESGITPGTKLLVRQPRDHTKDAYSKFSDNILMYCSCTKHNSRNVANTFLYIKQEDAVLNHIS